MPTTSTGSSCLIYFDSRQHPMDLDAAQRALADSGLEVVRTANPAQPLGAARLDVRWDDGPVLHVHLSSQSHVAAEGADVARGTEHAAAMAACDARFEITFDDLDAVLDEINTLIQVQMALRDPTRGLMFNTWNGHLSGPDDA